MTTNTDLLTTQEHPSVHFQRGEVHDFETAMSVYVAQFQEEITIVRKIQQQNPGYPDDEIQQMKVNLANIKGSVEMARAIYEQVVVAAYTQAAHEMRATGDYHLCEIASAVEQQWYDILAI